MRADRFFDYYEALQISMKADFDTVDRIYRFLAKKYHPDNQTTGNAEKFNLLATAYKILSDPEKRAAYDANYETSRNHQWQSIAKAYESDGDAPDHHIRRTILSILYTKRRGEPSNGGVGIVELENIMQWPGETLDFHIWYLKEKGLIERTETGGFEITADGVDKIETDGLIVRKDRLLTEYTVPSGNNDLSEWFHTSPISSFGCTAFC
jgi:curved DNA-binding protein